MGSPSVLKSRADQTKFSFRRQVLPPLCGLLVMLLVLGFFNSQFIAARLIAQKQPAIPANAVPIPDDTQIDPKQAPRIIISKIGVDAPLVFNLPTVDETGFQLALRNGVVHYPGTATPGQTGNTVFFGHSSGQVWAPGNYKFVFTHLEKLRTDDTITVEYSGTRYTYTVTSTEVVAPNAVSVLRQPSNTQELTLITCTPVGTDKNRFILHATQTKPAAKTIVGELVKQSLPDAYNLPGNTGPSVLQSVRSLF